MLNHTRLHLEHYDNVHEFERLASDLLNSLNWVQVEPMAPMGGADGGVDVRYLTKIGEPGFCLVTLRKDIRRKFVEDLEKIGSHAGRQTG